MRDSVFSSVQIYSFPETVNMSVEDIVGLQLSTSYASPRLLGDRVEEFKSVLSERLGKIASGGSFKFERTYEVIVAFRP